jgi:hypothetical protein
MKKKIKSTPPDPPLGINMPFDEALRRFIGTDPAEVEANITRSKKKKPPGGKKRNPTGGKVVNSNVVQLRHKRKINSF